jgi:hypothetical protein
MRTGSMLWLRSGSFFSLSHEPLRVRVGIGEPVPDDPRISCMDW